MLLPGVDYVFAGIFIIVCISLSLIIGILGGLLAYKAADSIIPNTKSWKTLASGAKAPYKWWMHKSRWCVIGSVLTSCLVLYVIAGPAYWVLRNILP